MTKPFPETKDIVFVGNGQIAQRGESSNEALEVGHYRRHLSLLQHDLADPDAIGIATHPPGEVAPMAGEPCQKASAQAQLAAAQVELERMTIRALVDGRVDQFVLRPGDIVQPAPVMMAPAYPQPVDPSLNFNFTIPLR